MAAGCSSSGNCRFFHLPFSEASAHALPISGVGYYTSVPLLAPFSVLAPVKELQRNIFPWFPTDLVRSSTDHFPKVLCTPDLIFFFFLFLSRMEFLFPFYSPYLCWLHLCSPFHNEPCRLSRFHALLHSVNPLRTTVAPLQSPFLSLWSWTKCLYLVEPRKSHLTCRGCSKWGLGLPYLLCHTCQSRFIFPPHYPVPIWLPLSSRACWLWF